eukprot:1620379-Prymnesium_polylepis.1
MQPKAAALPLRTFHRTTKKMGARHRNMPPKNLISANIWASGAPSAGKSNIGFSGPTEEK